MKPKAPIKAREAAYLAVLSSIREECYMIDFLEKWGHSNNPSTIDFNLAKEIAYGTMRMSLALDYFGQHFADKKKLNLKSKEKILLRTAIYQRAFMDRIPLYAIANETIDIAKRHCHNTFVGFLNALLRKMDQDLPLLPQGNSIQEMSIRYSYPPLFIEELIQNRGLATTEKILDAGNQPAPTVIRFRPQGGSDLSKTDPEGISGINLISKEPCLMGIINDTSLIPKIAASSDYYIQNATPATLVTRLCQQLPSNPEFILDLCAAPGGKIIAVHDFFPKARLFANDSSQERLHLLASNCAKYQIPVTLSCSKGEEVHYIQRFDVIILDVPCSNSGVFNKRPEARWRLTSEALQKLEKIQLNLIQNAINLLSPGGVIWYMTCSILKKENEEIIEKACQQYNLHVGKEGFQETILPNSEGWDGGFACSLKKGAGAMIL